MRVLTTPSASTFASVRVCVLVPGVSVPVCVCARTHARRATESTGAGEHSQGVEAGWANCPRTHHRKTLLEAFYTD